TGLVARPPMRATSNAMSRSARARPGKKLSVDAWIGRRAGSPTEAEQTAPSVPSPAAGLTATGRHRRRLPGRPDPPSPEPPPVALRRPDSETAGSLHIPHVPRRRRGGRGGAARGPNPDAAGGGARGMGRRRYESERSDDAMNVRSELAFVAAMAFAASAAGRTAPNDPSAYFDAGSKAFSSGDYAGAAAAFEAARDAGMTGPAVEYNAGVSYYRLGDYSRAEDSFRKLAQSYPQMSALAEYNLGLALAKQERYDEARAAFERARAAGDATIAALATAMLDRTAESPAPLPRSEWTKLLDFAVGYDDNVWLLEESSLPAE